ncbi:uncharacterized protein LOC115972857 [Quercus lobata]|uniref:uncharacterized protein LOC115972857 n=1 Tax=Quercus lobata TaxID=97700 RepID=UPI001243BFC3|nr:uncharacterized protein LOC115972857 [Quercus lobata]
MAKQLHQDFITAITVMQPSLLASNLALIRWSPPANSAIKLNFDGSVFQEFDDADLGVVARDSKGLVLAPLVEKVLQPNSVAELEAMAAVCALNFAQELNLSSIILECDSEIIFKALRSNEDSLFPYGHLIAEAKLISDSFCSITFNHVRRQGNYVAHNFARYVISFSV